MIETSKPQAAWHIAERNLKVVKIGKGFGKLPTEEMRARPNPINQLNSGEIAIVQRSEIPTLRGVLNVADYTQPVLTNRQREVLIGIAQGKTREELGQDLGISPNTVKNHINALFDKLDVDDRHLSVIKALRTRQLFLSELG